MLEGTGRKEWAAPSNELTSLTLGTYRGGLAGAFSFLFRPGLVLIVIPKPGTATPFGYNADTFACRGMQYLEKENVVNSMPV